MPTISATCREVQARLEAAHEVAPREGRYLVQHVLQIDDNQLILQGETPFPADKTAVLEELLVRRASGEPLGYVLGYAWFYGRTWEVAPGVLIPRPDTEILVEECLKLFNSHEQLRICELGVGSGCIGGTLLAERRQALYFGAEISETAAIIARRNLKRGDVDARATVEVRDGLEGVAGPFDLLVSNPPYVTDDEWNALEAEVKDHEPRLALTGGVANADGLHFYRKLALWGGELVRNGGWLCLEVGWQQGQAVRHLLQEQQQANGAATWHNITVTKDLGGRERVVCAQRC